MRVDDPEMFEELSFEVICVPYPPKGVRCWKNRGADHWGYGLPTQHHYGRQQREQDTREQMEEFEYAGQYW